MSWVITHAISAVKSETPQMAESVLEILIAPQRKRHHHRQEILASGGEPIFIASAGAGVAVGDPCDDLRRLQLTTPEHRWC
jgi:hypothetical protein